jgi:putative ABC transport system permease protein
VFRTTLRSLWSHKRRLISTCIAVVLGVAFMTGTFVLSATVNQVFDDLFGDLGENIDAVVRGDEIFESQFAGTQRALLPEEAVDAAAAVDGVAEAEGSISVFTLTLLDGDGDPVGGGFGPPTIVGTWTSSEQMASYQVAEGRAPAADDELIIDRAATKEADLSVGDEVRLATPQGNRTYTLVGTSRFGNADSAGGSIFIGTTLAESQLLAGEAGKVDTIAIRAEEGVTPEQLVERLEAADLDPAVDIVTGQQAADEQANEVKSGFAFFTTMLLVFAFIALFVGWFIISNTFNILVAQRTKELALLRAIGASRRQVLGSVFLEAAVIGIVSAVLGFIGGVLLAQAAFSLLAAVGLDLPQTSLVVTPQIAAGAMFAGLAITAVAAIGPAVRATRVPPMAALRDVAIDRTGASRTRAIAGVGLFVLGLLLISPAFGDPTSDTVPGVGFGLFLIVVAVLVIGPVLAKPLSRIVGSPLPLIKGVTGRIARENAMRSPRRTASTAAALTIGVSLVAFITIFANSVQRSIESAIDVGFKGDYIILPVNQASFAGASPQLAEDLRAIDGVGDVTAFSFALGQLELPDGSKPVGPIGGIDEAFTTLFDAKMAEGALADIDDDEIAVDRLVAKQEGLAIGDEITVTAVGGREATFTVGALSDDAAILGQWTVTRDALTAITPVPTDFQIGIKVADGASAESVREPIRELLKAEYPTMQVQDREEFTSGIVDQISILLNVIYGLLAVSIIIALIGIANTLSLSIHERTRELGLLRATGMLRSQLRSSVRWEAVIVALIGTVVGTGLGLLLSYTMVRVLVSQGITEFAIPVSGMVTVVVFGAVLGVVASIWPAYKTSRMNVLDAIATE